MKIWSAKGEASSFHEANIAYPESAMMNGMNRRIEDTGCQGSEVGFCGWFDEMYLNSDDCCKL